MMRLDRSNQWHWEQDAALRFSKLQGTAGAAARVRSAISGRHWSELGASNLSDAELRSHLQLLEAHQPFFNLELALPPGDAEPLWICLSGVPVFDSGGAFRGYRGVAKDITAHKSAAAAVADLAQNDPLTGLGSRRLLLERLHMARLASVRSQENGALVFVDINDFKGVNQSLGLALADQLLVEVGERLSSCMREYDTVARLGVDVFVVLATALGQGTDQAYQNAQKIAGKILAGVAAPFKTPKRQARFTISLGICMFHGTDASAEDIFKRAEMALQQSKQEGRPVTRYVDPVMEAQVRQRTQIEEALGLALRHEELRLYYQPIVDLQRRIIGYEALLRWNHPELGLVGPNQFIAVAEQTGLIVPMGEWVIATACRQLAEFRADPAREDLTIAVNLSARQLAQPDLVESVKRILEQTGAPAERLKLELTESMLLTDIGKTIEKLHELTRLGIRFSLDDFGTGYSSLSYLKKLPLSQLKIDQSFVRELLTDPVDAAIVRTIVQLARSLGMTVIAEGVELEGQRKVLADMGCREFQGYLFGKPHPLE